LLAVLLDAVDSNLGRAESPLTAIFDNPEDTDIDDLISDESVGVSGGGGTLLLTLDVGMED